MATTQTKSEYNVVFEEKIITSEVTYENPIDISKVPVISIQGAEVRNSSLTQKTPKFGHSVQLLVDEEFVQKDRQIRAYFTQQRQLSDPNCENYKGQVKIISKKDVLDGKFTEDMIGKGLLSISMSNVVMYDADELKSVELENESNKDVVGYKRKYAKPIKAEKDAKNGNVLYKYFRVIDNYSGQGIAPTIYKVVNGEKVYTFISPKDNIEKPLFAGQFDLVNAKVRPYERQNQKNGEWSCKYNLLEVEIVQTAYDRGKSNYKTSGKSKKTEQAPDTVDFAGLSSMFAGSVETVVTSVQEVKSAPKKTSTPKAEMTTVESVTGVPGSTPEVTQVQAELPKETAAPAMSFDFSQLGADLGNLNLGE